MAIRRSLFVSHSGGLLGVEDGRVDLSAILTPSTNAYSAKTGFRPGPGAITPGTVTATGTPDANVHIAPFQLFMASGRGSPGGAYWQTSDTTVNINILSTPANVTNARNDLIIAQQTDEGYGDASNTLTILQVVGTPSGTPADPTVTGSTDYITLARVRVRANTASILSTDITDLRPASLYTVALGGILPVPTSAAQTALTGIYDGFGVWRSDTKVLYIWDTTASVWRAKGIIACTSSSRPTSPAPNVGDCIYQTDTKAGYLWDGAVYRLLGTITCTSTTRPTSPAPNFGDRLFETDTGFGYTYSGTVWLRDEQRIVTVSDQSWTSNTTFADISSGNTLPAGGLGFAMEIGARYEFELRAQTTSSTGQLAAQVVQPAGTRSDYGIMGINTSGTLYNTAVQNQTATANGAGLYSTLSTVRVGGTVLCGGTAGTFKFQFAQNVSNASASWVLYGSSLRYKQVG